MYWYFDLLSSLILLVKIKAHLLTYIRQNTSEKENPWTEMEKIRVCVRKRPLGMKEVRRGEINIITIEDKETLLVHEKKEAVDLTQYILQVWCFPFVFGNIITCQIFAFCLAAYKF